jgi:hypothetical protein
LACFFQYKKRIVPENAKRRIFGNAKLRCRGELEKKGNNLPVIMQWVKQTYAVRFNCWTDGAYLGGPVLVGDSGGAA